MIFAECSFFQLDERGIQLKEPRGDLDTPFALLSSLDHRGTALRLDSGTALRLIQ
ncbi:MAG: hypothetical protein ACOVOL_04945 [Bacteroidia bacterium]